MTNYYDREEDYRGEGRFGRTGERGRYRGERYGGDYERDRGWEVGGEESRGFSGSGRIGDYDRGGPHYFTGDGQDRELGRRRDFPGSYRSSYDRNWHDTPGSERGYVRSYGSAGFGDGRGRASERDYEGTLRPPKYGRDYQRTGARAYRGADSAAERDWLDRASDEVQSWFGDEGAERRRHLDKIHDRNFRGRGPKGYRRSDERIREDVNDRLTEHAYLDASDIEVSVKDGEVTLSGKVFDRTDKRLAEDVAEEVTGVKNVQNNLRTDKNWDTDTTSRPASSARAA
jgi:osmotically-inducible protein OsmY